MIKLSREFKIVRNKIFFNIICFNTVIKNIMYEDNCVNIAILF